MALVQVGDRGTDPNVESNCEYIEKAVAYIRQGVVFKVGVGRDKNTVSDHSQLPWTWAYSLVRRERGMRYGAWNVRKPGQGHLTATVATELARYTVYLKISGMGEQGLD
jgi:hypothetical protein